MCMSVRTGSSHGNSLVLIRITATGAPDMIKQLNSDDMYLVFIIIIIIIICFVGLFFFFAVIVC